MSVLHKSEEHPSDRGTDFEGDSFSSLVLYNPDSLGNADDTLHSFRLQRIVTSIAARLC